MFLMMQMIAMYAWSGFLGIGMVWASKLQKLWCQLVVKKFGRPIHKIVLEEKTSADWLFTQKEIKVKQKSLQIKFRWINHQLLNSPRCLRPKFFNIRFIHAVYKAEKPRCPSVCILFDVCQLSGFTKFIARALPSTAPWIPGYRGFLTKLSLPSCHSINSCY